MQTGWNAKTLTRLVTVAAFVVVVASAGCTPTGGTVARNAAPNLSAGEQGVTPAFSGYGTEGVEPTARAPKVVNMFGEFDGTGKAGPLRTAAGDNGFQQHTFADEGFDADVAIDPSGKWMCFASTRHSERPSLYLQRVNGQSVTQVTGGNADDAYPAFSPDGKTIAFCSNRSGSWQVYVMDIDGRNVVQVTSAAGQNIKPSFAPDGKRLVYCAIGGRSQQWELWVANLETSEKRMIGYGLFPSWSSDKSVDRIAFQRARQRGSRWFSLWTLDLVDGEARRTTEVVASTNSAIVAPTWSPDGKKLAFATVVDPAQGKGKTQQDVWTINADGTNRQRVTDGSGVSLSPFWATDNRVYFVSNRGGTESVWSSRTDARDVMTAGLAANEMTTTTATETPVAAAAPAHVVEVLAPAPTPVAVHETPKPAVIETHEAAPLAVIEAHESPKPVVAATPEPKAPSKAAEAHVTVAPIVGKSHESPAKTTVADSHEPAGH